ncbi:hypothetical protein NL64_09870 [Pseudomonas fluorescens]|uniref:hypothetical protein n=1 Tax=Pseudomonas fluorescens TaxID=294 RepID=UPI00054C4124|nr:hypothetical protein [Pseudomonas fluorescens]KII33499.1 hypothetical protein NL64_09870 [Pseudomonas fluorescens]
MPSISDLKKPVSPQKQTGNPIVDAEMLRKESEELARISAVLSQDFPTKLGSPRAPVHEITVETPHIVRVMQAQAAKAQKEEKEANRPVWKRWVFWSSLVGGIGVFITFVLTVLTYFKTFGV